MCTRGRSSGRSEKKKLPDSSERDRGALGAAASVTTAKYETLRVAALGGALPLDARSGLVVFLRHGMWGWARSLAGGGAPQPPVHQAARRPPAPLEHRAVLHVLAAMAMNRNDRRSP
jgi:hypothetical protein